MTVQDLLDFLEGADPEAEVFLMEQPNYPFEYSVAGICERRDFTDIDDDEQEPFTGDRWSARSDRLPGNDVFLLEGRQVRNGSSAAWGA